MSPEKVLEAALDDNLAPLCWGLCCLGLCCLGCSSKGQSRRKEQEGIEKGVLYSVSAEAHSFLLAQHNRWIQETETDVRSTQQCTRTCN